MAFYVEETKTTPLVEIESGEINIKGRSIPEDSFEFYEPVVNACKEYVQNPAQKTKVSVFLEYVNSGSKKFLMNIFTILEKSYLEGNLYEIIWSYDIDDESILDLGNDLKSILKIPITIEPS